MFDPRGNSIGAVDDEDRIGPNGTKEPYSTIRILDAASGNEREKLLIRGRVATVAFNVDANRMVIANSRDLDIWDLEANKVRAVQYQVSTAASFDPQGRRLAATGVGSTSRLLELSTVGVWDASTGTVIATLEGHSNFVHSVAFDSTGALVLTASADGSARIWEVSSGKLLAQFGDASHNFGSHDLDDAVRGSSVSARFSPQGNWLLIQFGNSLIRWDVHLETRTPEAIGVVVDKLPWKLRDGVVVSKHP